MNEFMKKYLLKDLKEIMRKYAVEITIQLSLANQAEQ